MRVLLAYFVLISNRRQRAHEIHDMLQRINIMMFIPLHSTMGRIFTYSYVYTDVEF